MIFEAAQEALQQGHGAAFEVDHYMAGLGATMTAAASLLGALAALGITKKKTMEKASDLNATATETAVLDAFERGLEKGAELAKQHA